MPTPTNKQLISGLYVATFNRAPDLQGLTFWDGQFGIDQTQAMKQLAAGFVTHPAFTQLYGGLNNPDFVNAIYMNVLGGPGDAAGVLFWTNALTAGMSRSDFLAAFVTSALTADLPNSSLTPAENEAAITRQEFLYNKANVGLTFAAVLGADSNLSPTTDPSTLDGPNGLNSDPAYQASVVILQGVTSDDATALAATNIIYDAAATSDPTGFIIDNPLQPPVIPGQNFNYTTAIDHLVGTGGNDSFTGSIGDPITGDTLQSGDTANGNGGDDVVNVAIYGNGAVLTGLNTTAIETISVKALTTANEGSTLDLSGTKGVTTLESTETDGAQLTFSDIQTVDTDIRIVDTNETHTFIYDLNAYHADPSQNVVDLTLQELRDAEINFGDKLDPAVGQSQATQIDITSTVRPGTPVSPAVNNLVSDLNVGDLLTEVYIDGDANLKVTAPLDVNIELVDAHVVGNLAANLWLDMSNSNDGAPLVDDGVAEIIYEGALGDDHIEFGTTNNAKQVRLVTGNDWVRTGTGVASVDGGAGNDTIITGALNDLVIGGTGDDTVIDSGADNSTSHENIWYWDNGNNFDLGAGNDSLTVNGNGNNTVSAGDGNDTVGLYGDGNDSVVAGAGDDVITIIGDAVVLNNHTQAHYIDLGAGNDTLTINGGVIIEDPRDFNAVTTIIGGDGNDTVVIDGPLETDTNHVLNANLGNGNDSITLRADDLRNNDTVNGGDNVDTLVLTNASGLSETGLVRDSETQRTNSFENIDLRDQGIYFSLTDNLIASADGNAGAADDNAITVITESANGTQTVDTTALTVPTFLEDNFFNLRGGDFRDIVRADEESINSFNILRFDNPNNAIPDSTQDTLRIVDGAQLTYGDLYKVSGLEHIELTAVSTVAQTWEVELNSTIINQTTSTADLIISVDPNVTAGSKLYVTVDPTLLALSNSNVRILRNGNVDVYVNGQLVIEDQFDNVEHPNELIAFNPDYGLYVQTALHFTTNEDYLVGTQFDDTFTADTVLQVQSADTAKGYAGFDTLSLNFAVGNSNETLYDQLNYVQLDSIERIEFNTGNSVRMDGIDYEDAINPWFAPDLQELATGQSADTLTNMRQGVSYDLGAGNDFISLDDRWDHSVFINTTVNGGVGIDTVEGTVGEDREFSGSDSISISNVEFVNDYSTNDADHVDILATGSQAAGGLITLNNIEVILGTSVGDNYANQDPQFIVGNDNIFADSDGGVIWLDGETGEDTLVVGSNTPSRTTVAGGYDADEITVRATNYALVFGDYMDASAHGPGQNFGSENLFGVDGNDNIDVTIDSRGGEDDGHEAIVYGQGGNDTINVTSYYSHETDAWVDGGSGHDDINVSYMENATILGGSGDDSNYIENGIEYEVSITSEYNHYATVDGGDGNDNIIVLSNDGGEATIIGGAGNDTITVTDSIGVDTLQFGDITYNALQQPTDTQGLDQINGYNWEDFVSGDAGPINQDVMDFGTFFANSPTDLGDPLAENAVLYAGTPFSPFPPPFGTPAHNATWEHGVTVDANFFAGDSLVVLSTQGLTLTAADFSVNQLGTIQLNDNARAVVVVGTNETSPGNGISEFDIYFVQDIDTGNGPAHQTWAVDHVATVDSLTAVGINTVFQNLDNNWL